MDTIFNFTIPEIGADFLTPSFDKIRKGNLLRVYVKELVINKITEQISIERNQVEEAKNIFFKENKLIDNNRLNQFLLYKGINEEDLEYQISLPLKLEILSNQVNQSRIENHFLKRKDELDLYKYNVIRIDNSDLAHEIYFQLEGGESNFFDLSRRYSLDKKIFPDGVVGPKNTVGLHPVIKEKLRTYDNGDLIKPFQIDKWWLIIKLLEKKEAILDQNTSKQMALELCEIFVHDPFVEKHNININPYKFIDLKSESSRQAYYDYSLLAIKEDKEFKHKDLVKVINAYVDIANADDFIHEKEVTLIQHAINIWDLKLNINKPKSGKKLEIER